MEMQIKCKLREKQCRNASASLLNPEPLKPETRRTSIFFRRDVLP